MTDPAAQPRPAASAEEKLPLRISPGDMEAACQVGTAIPLSDDIDGIIRYAATWWVGYENGWLRITDEHVLADLNRVAARIAAARAAGTRIREGLTP